MVHRKNDLWVENEVTAKQMVVARAFSPSIGKAEGGGSVGISGQPSL